MPQLQARIPIAPRTHAVPQIYRYGTVALEQFCDPKISETFFCDRQKRHSDPMKWPKLHSGFEMFTAHGSKIVIGRFYAPGSAAAAAVRRFGEMADALRGGAGKARFGTRRAKPHRRVTALPFGQPRSRPGAASAVLSAA